jgi:hypothetical protein
VRQLHNQLSYHYPSYKKFFSEIDGKSALAFWEAYPSPKHLKGVSVEELARILTKIHAKTFFTLKKPNFPTLRIQSPSYFTII